MLLGLLMIGVGSLRERSYGRISKPFMRRDCFLIFLIRRSFNQRRPLMPKKPAKKKSASKMIAAAKKEVDKKSLVKATPKATPEEAKQRTVEIREIYKSMHLSWWNLGRLVNEAIAL